MDRIKDTQRSHPTFRRIVAASGADDVDRGVKWIARVEAAVEPQPRLGHIGVHRVDEIQSCLQIARVSTGFTVHQSRIG